MREWATQGSLRSVNSLTTEQLCEAEQSDHTVSWGCQAIGAGAGRGAAVGQDRVAPEGSRWPPGRGTGVGQRAHPAPWRMEYSVSRAR